MFRGYFRVFLLVCKVPFSAQAMWRIAKLSGAVIVVAGGYLR